MDNSMMKIAIMQPYFFPYIGQFQLINAADRFILADDVQYIRHGWINRNRVLKPAEGQYYIIMPLQKHSTYTTIKDIKVVNGSEWKVRILRQVEHYKKRAPFYKNTHELLMHCFHSYDETNITRLNGNYLQAVCDYIGINFKVEISSELGITPSEVSCKEDRVIKMCYQLGAQEYLNPPGGMELYDKESFEQKGIKLTFLKPDLQEYNQYRNQFEPGLSIIDVMMFNSPQEIRYMLNQYQLL
jgi:hypothetical protein